MSKKLQSYATVMYGVTLPNGEAWPSPEPVVYPTEPVFPRAPEYDIQTVLKLLSAHYRRQAEKAKGKKAKKAYLDAAETAENWAKGMG